MPSYKIKSAIVVMGDKKTKMDIEFALDNGSKVSISGYEVDADTDAGIHEVLSRAADDLSARAPVVEKEFSLPVNKAVDSSKSLDEALRLQPLCHDDKI